MALLSTALGPTRVAPGAAKKSLHQSVRSEALRCEVVPAHMHQGPKGTGRPSFENTLPPRPLQALSHPNPSPYTLPLPALALCPVALQGGDLDDVAGYGRNVRVGTRAGRGRPTFPLRGERWGGGDADDGCGDLGGFAVWSQSVVCFQIKAGATGIKKA